MEAYFALNKVVSKIIFNIYFIDRDKDQKNSSYLNAQEVLKSV